MRKKIEIAESVLSIIQSYKQTKKGDNESGGILLGQVNDKVIYINKVSTPNKFDRGERYSFESNKDAAQVIIDFEFYNSDKKTIYLGEWHTHPESVPTPSSIDINMIKKQFKKNKLNEPFLILLIQGLTDLYIGYYDGNELIKI